MSTSVKTDGTFYNKIIAKLVGHSTNIAPTIMYVPQSGCLVSGQKGSKSIPSDILVYELHKQLIDKIDINYSMDIRPSFVIQAAHQDSIVALAYL